MTRFLKQLLCKHNYELICWHWNHGFGTYEPRQIEAQYKCKLCNKIKYIHITNANKMKKFENNHKDKEWSNTCEPILNI